MCYMLSYKVVKDNFYRENIFHFAIFLSASL